MANSVVGKAAARAVVDLEGRSGLLAAEFEEAMTERDGFFAVVVSGDNFGFSSAREDVFRDFADDQNWAVRRRRWRRALSDTF